ncbi:MAG: methyltransferase domain-containing protein [Verrucomicrobiales bacterium]
MNIDTEKLHSFLGKMVGDMGATASGALVVLGDRLGLFAAVAEAGGGTPEEIATAAGNLDERYVREWLSCMAASGYVEYDGSTETFAMTPEQAAVFAVPHSPALLTGGYYGIASMFIDEPKIAKAFQSGNGVGWGDHHSCLFCGVERFFRPGYEANLTTDWIPSLTGAREKLVRGARVADVGCGHGCSTSIMAKAFPNSEFIGFDPHEPSVVAARKIAADEGVSNVRFEVGTAQDFPGDNYDLVACFDCLHDMGDPAGAAAHIRETLNDDGSWLIVEPMAGDTLAENLNPVGRLYYAFSTMICTPAAKSQDVGLALGAQAGEKRLRDVVTSGGGFSQFRRAAETPFNLILEARI